MEIKQAKRKEPVAVRTVLGWTLYGFGVRQLSGNRALVLRGTELNEISESKRHKCDDKLQEIIKHYFSLDSIGILTRRKINTMERKAEKLLEQHTSKTGNQWQTCLLWKSPNVELPDNYPNALNRLYSLERKLDKNTSFGHMYCQQMNTLIAQGYVRKIIETEDQPKRTWYLPHFGVTNINKPNKLRIVFDAAAKWQGTSLNDCLLPGPDLLMPLVAILMCFRQKPVAFAGDIKDMFLQIKIRPEDQQCQRDFMAGLTSRRKTRRLLYVVGDFWGHFLTLHGNICEEQKCQRDGKRIS